MIKATTKPTPAQRRHTMITRAAFDLLSHGHTDWHVKRELREQFSIASSSTAAKYVTKARKLLLAQAAASKDGQFAGSLGVYRAIVANSKDDRIRILAQAKIDSLLKLEGRDIMAEQRAADERGEITEYDQQEMLRDFEELLEGFAAGDKPEGVNRVVEWTDHNNETRKKELSLAGRTGAQ